MSEIIQNFSPVIETRKHLTSRSKHPTPGPVQHKEVASSLFGNSKKEVLNGSWRCNLKVSTLATLSLLQADHLIEFQRRDTCSPQWYEFADPDFLLVELTYPLSGIHEFTLRPMRIDKYRGEEFWMTSHRFSEGYLLWAIAREYRYIYEHHEQYGVWGHGIGDLFIESIAIDTNGLVDVGIGS